jgi:hypothetical protein
MHRRHFIGGAAASLVTVAAAGPAQAQLGGLGGLGDKLKRAIPNPLAGKAPITTSLEDAKWGDASKDGFVPRQPMRSLMELQRTPNGGFVVQPGYFQFVDQSYCLKAGTHGPGGGDGYLFAPTKGPQEEFVVDIVRSSVNHPEIAQHDVQVLLWAIIARAKFEDLPTPLKVTAAKMLNSRQLALLNRNALDMLPGPALDQALERAPALVRQVLQAEAQLRQMLVDPASSFEQLERVAVLAGMVEPGEGSRAVPSGRWSLHPDGYYVRYIPQGYSHTLTQIWVPQGSASVGKEYDPALHIAVPGNTGRQRLIQSGRVRADAS